MVKNLQVKSKEVVTFKYAEWHLFINYVKLGMASTVSAKMKKVSL